MAGREGGYQGVVEWRGERLGSKLQLTVFLCVHVCLCACVCVRAMPFNQREPWLSPSGFAVSSQF